MDLDKEVAKICDKYTDKPTLELLDYVINHEFKEKIAIVSSFGTGAALGLALTAEINPNIPVIFLNTLKHFPETLEYKQQLIDMLKLTNVRSIKPEPSAIAAADPQGNLCKKNPDSCCYLRKVVPLEEALFGFDAWITGRKRAHGGTRSNIQIAEHDGKRIKINPFAFWSGDKIDQEWKKRGLPEHPMVAFNYTSVGCQPCTEPSNGENGERSGRWAGFGKQECGIHGKVWGDNSGGI